MLLIYPILIRRTGVFVIGDKNNLKPIPKQKSCQVVSSKVSIILKHSNSNLIFYYVKLLNYFWIIVISLKLVVCVIFLVHLKQRGHVRYCHHFESAVVVVRRL